MTMDSEKRWQALEVALNPHVSLTIGELIDGWRAHVRRFVAELDAAPANRAAWGAHDYIGALHIREALERGLALLQDEDRDDAMRQVAEADRKLRAHTEPDRSGLLDGFLSPEPTRDSWWWHRVPSRGPVRYELDSHEQT